MMAGAPIREIVEKFTHLKYAPGTEHR